MHKYGLAVLLIFVALFGSWYYLNLRPGPLDSFAQCLGDAGAKFYGAFWCPHCADQKKLFGRSDRLLPYIECSTQDRRAQLPPCIEAGVTNYPTWIYADGEKETGVVSLEKLSQKTGCVLPE